MITNKLGYKQMQVEEIIKMAKPLPSLDEIVESRSADGAFIIPLFKEIGTYSEEAIIDRIDDKWMQEIIRTAIERLTHREKRIILLRYGFFDEKPRTLEEIGSILGITRERVRQIEHATLDKLKQAFQENGIEQYWLDGVSEKSAGNKESQIAETFKNTENQYDNGLSTATTEMTVQTQAVEAMGIKEDRKKAEKNKGKNIQRKTRIANNKYNNPNQEFLKQQIANKSKKGKAASHESRTISEDLFKNWLRDRLERTSSVIGVIHAITRAEEYAHAHNLASVRLFGVTTAKNAKSSVFAIQANKGFLREERESAKAMRYFAAKYYLEYVEELFSNNAGLGSTTEIEGDIKET